MKKLWSTSLVVVALSVASGAVQSRSLRITGTAGYLSEWELSGSVTERISGGSSVNGPQEKHGEIRFQMYRSGSQINATISLDAIQCTYSGDFSGSSSGHMDCSDAHGVPLSISIK
jgi:hypothetical protein